MEEYRSIEKGKYVRQMFRRIAGSYDLVNRVMTGYQDQKWRNEVVNHLNVSGNSMSSILDLGTGTGDLAYVASQHFPGAAVFGGDFTIEMMRVGLKNHPRNGIRFFGCDAQKLPFSDQKFDAVISGFLLRNVGDLSCTLGEQYRVLKPGGCIVSLDTTRPPDGWFSPLVTFYLSSVIPLIGGVISGDREAYRYLPNSTAAFLKAEDLAQRIADAGFHEVGFTRRMFGTIAIHWGIRSAHL